MVDAAVFDEASTRITLAAWNAEIQSVNPIAFILTFQTFIRTTVVVFLTDVDVGVAPDHSFTSIITIIDVENKSFHFNLSRISVDEIIRISLSYKSQKQPE